MAIPIFQKFLPLVKGIFLHLAILTCLKLKIILMPMRHILGWHVLIPYSMHASHILCAQLCAPYLTSSVGASHNMPSVNTHQLFINPLTFFERLPLAHILAFMR